VPLQPPDSDLMHEDYDHHHGEKPGQEIIAGDDPWLRLISASALAQHVCTEIVDRQTDRGEREEKRRKLAPSGEGGRCDFACWP
jgi:hypothetical protein